MMNYGVFPVCLILILYKLRENGWKFNIRETNFFIDGKLRYAVIFFVLLDTVNTIFASYFVSMTFKYSILAEVNQGVI